MSRRSTRVGAAAVALGLSLGGPQAVGVAAAETAPDPGSVSDSTDGGVAARAGAENSGAAKREARTPRSDQTTGPRPGAAATGVGGNTVPRASTGQAGALRPTPDPRPSNPGNDIPPAAQTNAEQGFSPVSPPAVPGAAATVAVGAPTPAPNGASQGLDSRRLDTRGLDTRGPNPRGLNLSGLDPVIALQSNAAATTAEAVTANSMAVMTAAVGRFVDSASNWVAELPQSPITEFLQGALLLVRRTLSSFIAATGWGQSGGQTTASAPYLSEQELRDYLLTLAEQRYGSLFGTTVPVYNYSWEYRYLADGMAAGGPTSDTNTQVDGVDEADFVETDGRYVYVARNGSLTILGTDSTVAAQTALPGYAVGQFLSGDRLTVITQNGGGWYGPMVRMAGPMPWWNYNPQTTVTVYDVSDPTAPTLASQTVFDGGYQDARAVDGQVYLVLNRSLNLPQPLYTDSPVAPFADPAKGPTVVAYRTYETWDAYVARVGDQIVTLSLPHAYAVDADGNMVDLGVIAGGGQIVRPRAEDQQSLLTVASIDADASGASAFAAGIGSLVGSSGATVYMTPDALYLATAQYNSTGADSSTDTRIDRFVIDGASVSWQAGGVVDGTLINQFAMDEYDGHLRVATHTMSSQFAGGTWATVRDNGVYVLDTEGDTLDLVGSVTGLAPGEQLYAVRFAGETGYLVTFLQTDPLFAIDLRDPAAPAVEGELVIPGFSNYLQSVGDGLLLGIGQEREPGTWNTRMHVSLFDVSDGANLTQIDRQFLDADAQWSWSEAQFDHHAVLFSAEDGLLVVPVAASGYDPQTGAYRYDTTLQVLTVDATGVTVRGVIHTDGSVSRTVRIGDVLYAIGDDHVTAYRLGDLTEIGRVPLGTEPRPVPVPLAL